jgi:Tfp pilus assembly protein PilV
MSDSFTLSIVCKGEVVSSNLPEFRQAVAALVGSINRNLTTDNDFAQAKTDVKKLTEVEARIADAKDKALRDAEQLHALFSALDDANEEVRAARLDLQKQVERQEKAIKAQLVADALNRIECAAHLRLKNFGAIIEGSIKGKRTLDSIQKALDVIVGSLNAQITAAKAVIDEWETANQERVPDADLLEIEQPETVRLKLQARTAERKAAEERKRLADEAAAERAARIKAEAEAKAQEKPQEDRVYAPAGEPLPTQVLPASAAKQEFALTAEESADEELTRFISGVRAAFAPIKTLRQSLKNARNIELAQAFASGVNAAFNQLLKGGDK